MGTAYAWGGDEASVIRVLGSIDKVAEVAAGGTHSVFLTPSGDILAWGDNDEGQLGIGPEVRRATPNAPAPVSGLPGASAIAAGGKHSLALTSDGAWAWGLNAMGQLGDGSTTSRATPVRVQGSDAFWHMIAAGLVHSLALSGTTVWSWGDNSVGQLGDGSTTTRLLPVRVEGLPRAWRIAAGGTHSLALAGDGDVWAWGLDLTVEQSSSSSPLLRTTPARVAGLSDVYRIAAGGVHALALKRDGTVWAWGGNSEGQIGDGSRTERLTPVRVGGLSDVIAIAAGGEFSLALTRDGQVWGWGQNLSGQLGDGSRTDRLTPVRVGVSGVGRISAGLNDRGLARKDREG